MVVQFSSFPCHAPAHYREVKSVSRHSFTGHWISIKQESIEFENNIGVGLSGGTSSNTHSADQIVCMVKYCGELPVEFEFAQCA